jgi:hypothetical protein
MTPNSYTRADAEMLVKAPAVHAPRRSPQSICTYSSVVYVYSYSSVKGWKISDKTLASIVRICTPAAADPCLSQRKQRRSVRLSAVDLICTVDVRSAVESCIRVCTRQHLLDDDPRDVFGEDDCRAAAAAAAIEAAAAWPAGRPAALSFFPFVPRAPR